MESPSIHLFVLFCSGFMMVTDILTNHFVLLLNSRLSVRKPKKQTFRELESKTPDSTCAKLVIASTALRAYRNRHLGALMRCCEAWEPVGKCFEPISFECTDFQKLRDVIANPTRENLGEREAEIANLPGTQTQKDKALTRCRSGQRAWRAEKTRTMSQCCH